MKSVPKIGAVGELTFTVEAEHLIDFGDDTMPAVLSTPRLIGLLERTARQTLLPFLEAEERTVGIEIELRHLAPTPPGEKVTCRARVVQIEGKIVMFQVEAHDAHELIARGVHKRSVIRADRFARRVRSKAALE